MACLARKKKKYRSHHLQVQVLSVVDLVDPITSRAFSGEVRWVLLFHLQTLGLVLPFSEFKNRIFAEFMLDFRRTDSSFSFRPKSHCEIPYYP